MNEGFEARRTAAQAEQTAAADADPQLAFPVAVQRRHVARAEGAGSRGVVGEDSGALAGFHM